MAQVTFQEVSMYGAWESLKRITQVIVCVSLTAE